MTRITAYRWSKYLVVLLLFTQHIVAQNQTTEEQSEEDAIATRYTHNKESDLWSIEGGIGIQSILSNVSDIESPISPIATLSATRMHTPLFGSRINIGYSGLTRYNKPMCSVFTLGGDYLINLTALHNYDNSRNLNVYGIVGGKAMILGSRLTKAAVLGSKIEYNVTPRIGLFAEPIITIADDHADGKSDYKASYIGDLRLGVSYSLGSGFSYYKPSHHTIAVNNLHALEERATHLEESIERYSNDSIGLCGIAQDVYVSLAPLDMATDKMAYYSREMFDNTFVSYNIGLNGLLYRESANKLGINSSIDMGAQYGKWLNNVCALQANTSWTWSDSKDISHGVVTADALLNVNELLNETGGVHPISFIPFMGIGMGFSPNKGADDYSLSPLVSVGAQLRFKITNRFSISAEGRGNLANKNILEDSYSSGNVLAGEIKLGVVYNLNDYTFASYSYTNASKAKKLKKRIETLEKIYEYETGQRTLITATQEGLGTTAKGVKLKQMAQYINFSTYDSYIDDSQRQALLAISQWLHENPSRSIKVISFNERGANNLREERSNAIKRLLVEEYGVGTTLVSIVEPVDAGYADVFSSESIIVLVTE